MSKKNKGINILFSALTIIIHASGLGSPYEPVHVYAVKDNHVQRLHVSMFVKGVRKIGPNSEKERAKTDHNKYTFWYVSGSTEDLKKYPFWYGAENTKDLKRKSYFPMGQEAPRILRNTHSGILVWVRSH